MEVELSTVSLFSNTMYQVCSYHTTYVTIIIILSISLTLSTIVMLAKGNVTRANVADVEINNNARRLLFRENVTENTLWSGTVHCKKL